MAHLTADQLFSIPTLVEREVQIDGLPGGIVMRELTAQQLQQAREQSTNRGNTRAGKDGTLNQSMFEKFLVAYTIVTPKLDPTTDLGRLMSMPQSLFMRLLREAMAINGLSEEAQQAAAKTFQEDEGNGHAGTV
jgi:hypothetical protein